MDNVKVVYNPRCWDKIFLLRLKEVWNSHKNKEGFVFYSYLYEKLCRNFSIHKPELRQILEEFSRHGLVEISSVGIKLKYKLEKK